jgi:Nucleoside-diphosphate-sugar epimerases
MEACIVTGGTGCIGLALTRLLIENNYFVYVVCNPKSKRAVFLPEHKNLKIIPCDIGDIISIRTKITYPCKYFFHLSWRASYGEKNDDVFVQAENITATLNAVRFASSLNCKAFIGGGSQAQYGDLDVTLSEKVPPLPETPYGIAKNCAEQMSRCLAASLNMRYVWGRIASVYGPCDGPYTLITSLIHSFLSEKSIDLTSCTQNWDYLYSRDAARALLCMAESGVDGKAYCVASGVSMPLREYIDTWLRLIKNKTKVNLGAKKHPSGKAKNLNVDISSLTADTGFFPQIPFHEGIEKTLQWYINNPQAASL